MTLPLLTSLIVALIGLPLFLVLAVIALIGLSSEGLEGTLYFAEFLRLASNPTLVAIPLFALGGFILAESKAPQRLLDLSRTLLGWMPGSLAVVTVVVMALLTAFTGASGVTIIALGGLMLPAMLKGGYAEKFSLGLLTTSGSIGLLFPPSLPLILYGVVSEAPIDQLFLAGFTPGLILVGGMMAFSMVTEWGRRTVETFDLQSIARALWSAKWEIPLPIIVIVGIYSGFFTATEASVVTVVYVIFAELIATRDVPWRSLPGIIIETSVLVGGILLILGSALALTNYLVFADIPTRLLELIRTMFDNKIAFLFALNIFLLIVGCMMDVFSALVVVIPLILPLAELYGINLIHLGIIFLVNLEIGYSTPPVGLNLFISSFRFNKPLIELYRASFPFILLQLAILALLTYVPALTLVPLSWFSR